MPTAASVRVHERAGPALLIFAKEPTPGSVKTRLAAAIGAARAAQVYRELTALTLAHAVAARSAGVVDRIELWCAPSAASPYFRGMARKTGASLHAQVVATWAQDGACDRRRADPRRRGTARRHRLPAPRRRSTRACGRAVAGHDAVLGPAEDGGYVLVGARRPLPFAAVRWSSPHALTDTTAGFGRAGIRWAALPVLWDVDEPADLARFEALQSTLNVTAR